jgi:hypothetical protein
MIQNFDAQLQVALRALEEVVAPALGGADKHVVEQLMLSIATIGFVKTRLPEARRLYRMELRSCIDLARETVSIIGGSEALSDAIDIGTGTLADPEADLADFATASQSLRDGVTAASHAVVGQPCQAALDAVILEKGGALLAQNRLWCAPFGFELHPESLPAPAW